MRKIAVSAPFLACGVWMAALGLYFMLLRPALLPEDLRYFGKTLAEVQGFAPELSAWLRRVFTVMGGFMSAAGILTVLAAMHAPRSRAAVAALALAGASSVVLMSAVNFAIDSDFKWLLLAPALLWAAGLAALLLDRRSNERI
jgi:hypothetical protein